MKTIRLFLVPLAVLALAAAVGTAADPESDAELLKVINDYRKENNLDPVKPLPELTKVAHAHLQDLIQNKPHEKSKNLHAWSDKGKWTAGEPGSGGKDSWTIMWFKPKEIAGYPNRGLETIYFGSGNQDSAKAALEYWKKSEGNRILLLNQGQHKAPWAGVGAAKGKGFYIVWWGK